MPGKERVGVLGSADVGRELAQGFAARGYEVIVGSGHPARLEDWRRSIPGRVVTGTFAEAAERGELLVLAVRGSAAEEVVDRAGPPHFDGKVLLDATNPLDFSAEGGPGLFVGTTDSLGERLQRRLPGARVVKCFSTVGHTRFVDPKFHDARPKMLICGNDAGAKARATAIVEEFGWAGAIDLGGVESARWLEGFVPLWVRAGRALGTFEHALAFVT